MGDVNKFNSKSLFETNLKIFKLVLVILNVTNKLKFYKT